MVTRIVLRQNSPQRQQLGPGSGLDIPFIRMKSRIWRHPGWLQPNNTIECRWESKISSKDEVFQCIVVQREAERRTLSQGWALRSSATKLKRREMTLAVLCAYWLRPESPLPLSLLDTHFSFSLTDTQHTSTTWLYGYALEAIKSTWCVFNSFPLESVC